MRIGIVSNSGVQISLMKEMLLSSAATINSYNVGDVQTGVVERSGDHVLVIDFSDDAVASNDDVLSLLSSEDSLCIVNEKDLFTMSMEQRAAWRNKVLGEVRASLPDLLEITTGASKTAPFDVWVLGSSSGGPTMLSDFFRGLPRLPIALFIVQHIAQEAYPLFVNKIRDNAISWTVVNAENGVTIQPGMVVVCPRDRTVRLSDSNQIVLTEMVTTDHCNPSINNTIRSVFDACGDRLSVIILSGLGEDGASAIGQFKGKLQHVYAQDADSSPAASMPNAARSTGAVTLNGTARYLGSCLSDLYGHGIVV